MDNYGIYNSGAMGIYTPQTQFDFDPAKLIALGFNQAEVQTLQYIIVNGGKLSTNALTLYGIPYEQARKIRYMYDICMGKVQVESTNDLSKHMKKMFGNTRKIGIQDLAVSKINKVPRKAIVAGITDRAFALYNSKQYPMYERLYDVINVTGSRIFIETTRRPVLKFKQAKVVEGVIEIVETKIGGKTIVAFDKKYCKLCNRFIVVASLRKPEFHHGMIEVICIEGTKVYVYAQTLGTKENVSYNLGTQRVYDYGFFPNEIDIKLKSSGAELYRHLCGVYATVYPANQDFRILTIEEEEDKDDIGIED